MKTMKQKKMNQFTIVSNISTKKKHKMNKIAPFSIKKKIKLNLALEEIFGINQIKKKC